MDKRMADDLISEQRRLALMLLAHYYLARNKDGVAGAHLGRKEWFAKLYAGKWKNQMEREEAKKAFDNFLAVAARQGAQFVHDYLKPRMTKRSYYGATPRPVQAAIETAFEYQVDRLREGGRLAETVGMITSDGAQYVDRLVTGYTGLWDVIRFSAHGDERQHASSDPRVMRAVMQITPPETDNDFPAFEIRYRPGSLIKTEDYFVCRGSVMVLGRGEHLLFIGWENPTKYPIEIFALMEHPNGTQKVKLFFGLVVRRHEKGHIFASRVMFLRSSAPSFDEVAKKEIGMFRQSEIAPLMEEAHDIQRFDTLLDTIINTIGSGGRSGLWLRNP